MTEGQEWTQSLKKFYKDLKLVGEMQYGGQFYIMCEAFGLDPEQVKRRLKMKLVKSIYNYFCGNCWSNVWNVMLLEYYMYLGCWLNIAFN